MIPIARPVLGAKERENTDICMKSGWISSCGPFIEEFEGKFEALHKCERRAVACSSGTGALHLALLSAGVTRGDEVLLPDLTFGATANAVIHVGAAPVLVDIKKDWTIDIAEAEKKITPRTRAIISVDLYDQACDYRGLRALAEKHGLVWIEDRAETSPANPVYGDYGCFSFFANKYMTTGEGGMVLCRDPETVKMLRGHGLRGCKYDHTAPGLNYRMTNLQAGIGCAQIEALPEFIGRREAIASRYRQNGLTGDGNWLFVVKTENPEQMQAHMGSAGIDARPVFLPLHAIAPYRQDGAFPNAVAAHATGLCLPCGPHLTDEDVDYTSQAFTEFERSHAA